MKTYKPSLRLLVPFLIIGFVLHACVAGDNGQTTQAVLPTVTQPNEATSTVEPTMLPNLTPTLTQTSVTSPTPAPTPAFGSGRVEFDFLFGNQPEGCELPCWQGLKVGESDAGDIQAMFDTAFGFDGSKVFEFKRWEDDSINMPGLVNTRHLWTYREAEYWNDEFLVLLWIQENTRTLEAIRFDAEGNEFEPYSSPQQILRGLGVPSVMKVYIQQSAEDPRWGTLDISMMYGDMGIKFDYADLIPITSDPQGSDTAKLCLDKMQGPHYTVDVYITAPFPPTASELSPIQERYISSAAYSDEYRFQDIFAMSLEEVTRLAQEKDNACIYAKLP